MLLLSTRQTYNDPIRSDSTEMKSPIVTNWQILATYNDPAVFSRIRSDRSRRSGRCRHTLSFKRCFGIATSLVHTQCIPAWLTPRRPGNTQPTPSDQFDQCMCSTSSGRVPKLYGTFTNDRLNRPAASVLGRTRSSAVAERPRAHRVVENFAKLLKRN